MENSIGIIKEKILMVRPTHFGSNPETLEDNTFMSQSNNKDEKKIQQSALNEFERMVENLKSKNVDVVVYEQCLPEAKDSIFPNNWFSTHKGEDFNDGLLIIYPLKAPNRRLERNPKIIEALKASGDYKHFVDLSYLELEGDYLESTGSLIFDDRNHKIYCNVSDRATPKALDIFINKFNEFSKTKYELIIFKAKDKNNKDIYHTNVVMSVLSEHIIICLESITDLNEREKVENIIRESSRKILEVNRNEMNNFCCNVLSVRSREGKSVLVISQTAYNGLRKEFIEELELHYDMCISDIPTIEIIGGGSCRCMVTQVFYI